MAENENSNAFDIAAQAAEKKLASIFEELNPEEKRGAMAVFQWQAANYEDSGHKRLGRILVEYSKKRIID